jgi:UPF0755 protein
MKKRSIILAGVSVAILFLLGFLYFLFSAPGSDTKKEIFAIAPGTEQKTTEKLAESGFIKNTWAFNLVMTLKGNKNIQPGGYMLAKNMSAWQVADTLTAAPQLKWVAIPEELRKEEIGERLAKTLGWSDEELNQWNTVYTAMTFDYVEGVYFPDTYLIPVNENGLDIAKRMQNRFNERFAPYIDEFAKQDILWTTGLRLASIVQREAAGKEDMPLIAGILWNRLLKNQKLEVDATVQYARGKTDGGWWAPITPKDIETINSRYNTYKHTGLPPHPISNPGIPAIEAVLHPTETECLYYIHDNNRTIHCAKTLKEHEENIEKYLK